jgi:hypothetical protein
MTTYDLFPTDGTGLTAAHDPTGGTSGRRRRGPRTGANT